MTSRIQNVPPTTLEPTDFVKVMRQGNEALVPPYDFISNGDKGDITVSGSGLVWTIDNNAVGNTKLADMATSTVKGRALASGTGDPVDLTQTQLTALINPATTSLPGALSAADKTKLDGLALYSYAQLTSAYVLTSTTAVQKLLNSSTNGALTLATGRYLYRGIFTITGMSATSGNAQFSFGGTATLANGRGMIVGIEGSTTGALSGETFGTSTSAPMVPAAVATQLDFSVSGIINVTAGGTIIPSIALTTAAAATVGATSFFEVVYIGPTGSNTLGAWS